MSRAMDRPDLAAVTAGCLAAVSVTLLHGPGSLALPLAAGVLVVMAGWIARQDAATYLIPDGPVAAIAILGAALRLAAPGDGALREGLAIAIDGVLCGGALFAIREAYFRLKGLDGLGFGDVKLAAAGGILVGTVGFSHALLAASALGLAAVLALARLRPGHGVDRLPFGAFLAPALVLAWAIARP